MTTSTPFGTLHDAVALSSERLLSRVGPLSWPHDLYPYQLDGVRALLQSVALLLADDMGLGKTIQAIAAFRVLVHRGDAECLLIVMPAAVIGQWQRHLREWAPELRTSTVRGPAQERAWQWRVPAHVFLVSYETLRADLTDHPASPPRSRKWDLVVLDEAQKIKNRDTDVSRAAKAVPRRRAWALTGTPLENRVEDLASICEFLSPWEEGAPLPRLPLGPSLLEVHTRLQLRRKKADVLPDLPAKTLIEVPIELGARQRATYDRAEREGIVHLRSLGRSIRIANVLELITRLKQICNVCPDSGESAKLDDLESRAQTLADEGHRLLVFSQYTSATYGVRTIADRLTPLKPLIYAGDLTPEERERAVSRFKSGPDHKALVLSLRAGGLGLNLQDASYVVHFDRWWNPAIEHQAEDRTHRLGQTMPVTVYAYVCTESIEERIAEVLRSKQELFDALVDDVSLDITQLLTKNELLGLFGLSQS